MKEIERLLRAGIPAEELVKEIEEARARIELEKNSTKAKANVLTKMDKNLITYFSFGRTDPIPKEIEKGMIEDFHSYLKSSANYWAKREAIRDEDAEFEDWLASFVKTLK